MTKLEEELHRALFEDRIRTQRHGPAAWDVADVIAVVMPFIERARKPWWKRLGKQGT